MGADTTAAGLAADRGRTMGRTPVRGRLYGLGSIFGKTLRDSRRSIIIATTFLLFVLLTGAAAIASAFGTAATRQEMVALATTLPGVFQGMLGRPIGLETLGGLIEWRYFVITGLLLPVWSILALSGTLAGESDRGSMEFLATTTYTRTRIALEKLAAHLVAVLISLVALTIFVWLCGVGFATLPGDEISPRAALGYAALTGVLILAPGAVAFAAAPFLGRGPAAGLAAVVMVAGYFINGFRESVSVFETLTPASWYSWTAGHVPLAGLEDWASLGLLGIVALALFGVGVYGFAIRDVGRTVRVPAPHLPRFMLGLGGPLGRTFAERIGAILAWGLGIGSYVLIVSGTSRELADMLAQTPTLQQLMKFIYPDIDYTTVGGVLQLVFVEFGLIVFGFAAATLVGGWASEETSGRLDVLLAAPTTRVGWFVRSVVGLYLAIVVVAGLVAVATAIGASSQDSDVATPTIGAFVLALYGLAWAGVGVAAAGLFRASLAAPVVIVLTIGTFLITLFATALDLPDWVAELALTTHYGKPLIGDWDPLGVVVSLGLAVGGLAIGAWGLSRRDVNG
jgi:ABC-2 type transport system permease protein